MQKPINFDQIWLEDRDKEEVIPAKLLKTYRCLETDRNELWFRLYKQVDRDHSCVFASRNDYGSRWRAWAHKPTDEERKAAEWKD